MDIVGGDIVTLRVGTVGYPMAFLFAAASAPTANDGSIPFGSTITRVSVSSRFLRVAASRFMNSETEYEDK